ncbi:alkaline phosphatase D family protein [Marinigracilibium pacificum]|uniref:Alkaline phosphatase family protein n=1 Tax=Marinigracilibium pacificum TaxID=2729599 RepID=A0A848J9L0_9BACT|nr:alkaline phosphatase D family protein [Marinigracilibium pacificum]NMM49732.1 alkaline phosphatase family protein [Marinigracilibium pacificum]
MLKKYTTFCFLLLVFSFANLNAQTVQSGPMVGYSTMKEVLLWIQTTEEADVYFKYNEKGKSEKFQSKTVKTEENTGFIAKIIITGLQEGKEYEYTPYINGKAFKPGYEMSFQTQTLWQWRKDPPPLSFAAGSCFYVNESEVDRPGNPYGSNFEILTSIHKDNPDFMVWMGDNTYLREADWNSRSGIFHRYTHTRSLPELQPLLANTHHYAMWDDHDYGPNDADRSYWGKHITQEAFNLFWGNLNTGIIDGEGVTTTFPWQDIEFFMLDNRWFRSANHDKNFDNREMFGQKQLLWLREALVNSHASFKFIVMGGQALPENPRFERYSTYQKERAQFLEMLKDINVPGIIILSGDIHHTEMNKMERDGFYPLYEISVSSLTAGIYGLKEPYNNKYLLEETIVNEHNYGIFTVTGPRKERVLNIKIKGVNGDLKWEKNITAEELSVKR